LIEINEAGKRAAIIKNLTEETRMQQILKVLPVAAAFVLASSLGSFAQTGQGEVGLRIPIDVAQDSEMISPTIPI
jgi:hypothetical protein